MQINYSLYFLKDNFKEVYVMLGVCEYIYVFMKYTLCDKPIVPLLLINLMK